MRLLHMSDTHLGYSAYSRIDENGLNVRESDVYRSFSNVIDLAIEEKVDAVVHSGDLFDSVRPTNRAISQAVDGIIKLREVDLPFVVIAGNHSTPRLRETGSVFRVLEHLENVIPIYRSRCETHEVGDARITGLPHCIDEASQERAIASFRPDEPGGRYHNVGLLHGMVGISLPGMGEANEMRFPDSILDSGFDYLGLGHFHGHKPLAENAVYAGATERFSFNEAGDPKGVVLVDLERRSWEFREIPVRDMTAFRIDCARLDPTEILTVTLNMLQGGRLEGKIVKVIFEGISYGSYRTLDLIRLKLETKDALHVVFDPRIAADEGSAPVVSGGFSALPSEFATFMDTAPVERLDKKRLREMGERYLQEVDAE